MLSELRGAVVLVTGGGSGIGRATACALSRQGAQVVATGRRIEALEETRRRADGHLDARRLDVTNSSEVDRVIDDIVVTYGRLDGVVNAAGVSGIVASEDVSDEQFNAVLAVNLGGALAVSRAAARAMLPVGSGSIVHVGSLASRAGLQGRVAYACSKHAVIGLVRTLGVEWAGRGVRVNAVSPGWVRTELTERALSSGRLDAERIEARTPLGRWAEPEELVGAVLFLLGPSSGFVTGTELVVDGGWSAGVDHWAHGTDMTTDQGEE